MYGAGRLLGKAREGGRGRVGLCASRIPVWNFVLDEAGSLVDRKPACVRSQIMCTTVTVAGMPPLSVFDT